MSGIKPFFVNGTNVKIKLNGKTLAFCTDLSCSVQIITQTPKVLGKYEGSSVEPLGYTVSGSFTLVRYVKNAVSTIGSGISGASNEGNGAGNWIDTLRIGSASDIQTNPGDLEKGSTFDIEVYQVTDSATVTTDQGVNIEIKKPSRINIPTTVPTSKTMLGVLRIRNARITQADFTVSKRNVAVQRFNFVALYADEDSFNADFSGSPVDEIRY